jgi:hypothetical protein
LTNVLTIRAIRRTSLKKAAPQKLSTGSRSPFVLLGANHSCYQAQVHSGYQAHSFVLSGAKDAIFSRKFKALAGG